MSLERATKFFDILDDLLTRDAALPIHQVLVETSWHYNLWLASCMDAQDATPDVQWTGPVVSLPTGIDREKAIELLDTLNELNEITRAVLDNFCGRVQLAPTCIAEAIKKYNDWFPRANELVSELEDELDWTIGEESCEKG